MEFNALLDSLPSPLVPERPPPPKATPAGAVTQQACRCGTKMIAFASDAQKFPPRCSGCSSRARLEGAIEHSKSGDPCQMYSVAQLLHEPLELVHWAVEEGEFGLVTVLYFKFADEPLLPLARVRTSSRQVAVEVRKLTEGRFAVGFTQEGRAYKLTWVRL